MSRQFDAIIIGSGLGGLTAGALCARAGLRVLVLERNDNFGGAATVYRHNGLAIEASLHEIDGFDEEDPKLPLIQALGLDKNFSNSSMSAIFTKCAAASSASLSYCRMVSLRRRQPQKPAFRSTRPDSKNIFGDFRHCAGRCP